MRATLTFDLPDEKWEHGAALRGRDYRLALQTIAERLRDRLKYGDLGLEAEQELDDLRSILYELVPDIFDE